MLRKIVFINQATGYLTIDIVNAFVEEFDEVALITGSIRIQDDPLDEGVRTSSIIRYNRGGVLPKAVSWTIGTLQIFFLLRTKYRRHEIVFFTIPPLAYLLPLPKKTKFSLVIFDLFPQALLANGITEKSRVYRRWCKRNKKIFPRAHRIYTLSENMSEQIRGFGTGLPLRVIHNWSAFSGKVPVAKEENQIIRREDLGGKFIVQYSGNIGVTHNVETLVYLAEKVRNEPDIEFLIIGRGERSQTIQEMITERGLENCKLLPYRKDEELYESLCVADLAVVLLDDLTTDISVPSKTYNIFAAGVPLMAIAPLTSEVSRLVTSYGAGRAFNKTDLEHIYDYIMDLKQHADIHEKYAADSYKASLDFTSKNAKLYLEYYND